MQWAIDVENFSLQHGPTKNLGDLMLTYVYNMKEFFNQFFDDDYFDQIVH